MVAAGERRAYVTIAGHHYDSVAVIDTENKRVIANHPVAGHRDRRCGQPGRHPDLRRPGRTRTSSASR